jgi:hypothetical protein
MTNMQNENKFYQKPSEPRKFSVYALVFPSFGKLLRSAFRFSRFFRSEINPDLLTGRPCMCGRVALPPGDPRALLLLVPRRSMAAGFHCPRAAAGSSIQCRADDA